MTAMTITRAQARRFMRSRLLLDGGDTTLAGAIHHLGYVQIDPINVCGRMHDLILRPRVAGYREGDLMRHLHGPADAGLPAERRIAFEHHLPSTHILVAFSVEAWPHLLATMRARTRAAGKWSGRLTPAQVKLADFILSEIAARGPLSSEDLPAGKARVHVWGHATDVKAAMQKLFFHGRLLIAGRVAGRRRYDLPERILPRRIREAPEPPPAETHRWLVETALRQRRLVLLKRADAAAVSDLVQPVTLGQGPVLHLLQEDLPALEAAAKDRPQNREPILLAPLDPLIYDRRVTRQVWDFDYTWEAYTPEAKRKRGHYAMPILAGLELVGHVDPKADRPAKKLRVRSRSVRRGYFSASAVRDLASFLGLRP